MQAEAQAIAIGTAVTHRTGARAVIVPHHKSWRGHDVPAGYVTVRYEDGGTGMVHIGDLTVGGGRFER